MSRGPPFEILPVLALVLCTWSASAEGAPVGVYPLGGTASAEERAAASDALKRSITGIPGLEVVDLSAPGLFGEEQRTTLAACADDPCRREALVGVQVERLTFGELDREGEKTILRLRWMDGDPKGSADPKVRISREVGTSDLERVVGEAVLELFPEEAKAAFAVLVLQGGAPETLVAIDGKLAGELDGEGREISMRLGPGAHAIEARAPGHVPKTTSVELRVGKRTELRLELDKNRSIGPYLLGGTGVLLAGASMVVGLGLQATASDWETGCAGSGACAAGFTKARYDADQDDLSRGGAAVTGMVALSAAMVVGAVVWFILDPGVDTDLIIEEAP